MVTRVGASFYEVIKASLKLKMKPPKSAESKMNPNNFYAQFNLRSRSNYCDPVCEYQNTCVLK